MEYTCESAGVTIMAVAKSVIWFLDLVSVVADGAARDPYDNSRRVAPRPLPEMDGVAATAAIRTREGATRHTPIIALTAHALPRERDTCRAAGMDEYLTKPIMPQALDAAIRRWVARDAESLAPTDSTTPEAAADLSLDQGVLANMRKLEAVSGKRILPQLLASFAERTLPRLAALRDVIALGDTKSPLFVFVSQADPYGSIYNCASRTAHNAAPPDAMPSEGVQRRTAAQLVGRRSIWLR